MRKIQFKILDPRLGQSIALPAYATSGSAGMDLRACIQAPLILSPNTVALIPTGFAVYIAEPTLMGVIVPRSGLGHRHGIILGNSMGIIDSDYQGEILISCWNRSQTDFKIDIGDRVAQLLFVPVAQVAFEAVEAFHETQRGAGGFGHTGHQ